jgi:hypothetical protein
MPYLHPFHISHSTKFLDRNTEKANASLISLNNTVRLLILEDEVHVGADENPACPNALNAGGFVLGEPLGQYSYTLNP